MKRFAGIVMVLLAIAGVVAAQSGSTRAWQQKLQIEIPLPVPMIELESANPFVVELDVQPKLIRSTPPRKVEIRGSAAVAAYVNAKGECLGAVPLELPFPGLTSSLVQELTGSKFDSARSGDISRASWVVVGIGMSGKVKESSISEQVLTMPDPSGPPKPNQSPIMAPPGNLSALGYSPASELTSLASPRRIRVHAPGRDGDIRLRAMVHINERGRCDRYVPLELYDGLNSWLSAFLASWQLQPGTYNNEPVAAWMVYSAQVKMKLSGLESTGYEVVRDREYDPANP